MAGRVGKGVHHAERVLRSVMDFAAVHIRRHMARFPRVCKASKHHCESHEAR